MTDEEKAKKKREKQDHANRLRRERHAKRSKEEKRQIADALKNRRGERMSETQKRYYWENRARKLEQNKIWRQQNAEKLRAQYLANREIRLQKAKAKRDARTPEQKARQAARAKDYRENNLEKVRNAIKSWTKRNPEAQKLRMANRNSQRRASGKGSVTKEDALGILEAQEHLCVACGACLKTHKSHMDHIMPLSKGGTHTKDNIQFLCAPCNQFKAAKHPVDWVIEIYKKESS